jgi:diguanylate cyclase (GGDEF)-like protein
VIQRFVRVVPGFVWLALIVAIVLSALGGASALWSGQRVRQQGEAYAEMTAAALTDALTGVMNRRGFTEAVERELARARRYGRQFVLAYVDVRGLKAVNDTHGHQAGDQLLQAATHILEDSARADDVVGRIGGDELGLLLVEHGDDGAASVIKRIKGQVRAHRAALGFRAPWDLTIGSASYPADGHTVDELLQAADLRLYEQRGIALHSNGRAGHHRRSHAPSRR